MDDLEEMAQRIVLLSKGQLAFDGDFEALRAVAGSKCRIRLTLVGSDIPNIEGGILLSAEKNIYEYEFDTSSLSVRAVLGQIAEVEGVVDVEISKAPIEQVVAQLYTSWNGSTDSNEMIQRDNGNQDLGKGH
jgi:ABC-2 type transport system ATP-binding protein